MKLIILLPVFFDGIEYNSSKFTLNTGETLILYTDGITEACNKDKVFYGKENLKKILERNGSKEQTNIGNAVIDDVIKFQSGKKFDDITLVMLRRK